jgi:hypothetical protein
MNCINCNTLLVGLNQKRFCSKSCAAKFNNKKFPKRSKEKEKWPKCRNCSNRVAYTKGTYCRECINNKKHYHGAPVEQLTLENVIKRKGSNRYDIIRYHASYLYRKNKTDLKCANCSYDKHVEICHIKPIKDFSLTTTIKEINEPSNIVLLCPNCHWEFDKGLLQF